jgi:hypothetical protein
VCKKLLWRVYIADRWTLNGQNLKSALAEIMKVCLFLNRNVIDETQTKKWKFDKVGKYYVAPMFLLPCLMMCREMTTRRNPWVTGHC